MERLNVVLPSSPPRLWSPSFSGSLLGPALRLKLHEVAPSCWSQLSFVLSIWYLVWGVCAGLVLGLLLGGAAVHLQLT